MRRSPACHALPRVALFVAALVPICAGGCASGREPSPRLVLSSAGLTLEGGASLDALTIDRVRRASGEPSRVIERAPWRFLIYDTLGLVFTQRIATAEIAGLDLRLGHAEVGDPAPAQPFRGTITIAGTRLARHSSMDRAGTALVAAGAIFESKPEPGLWFFTLGSMRVWLRQTDALRTGRVHPGRSCDTLAISFGSEIPQ